MLAVLELFSCARLVLRRILAAIACLLHVLDTCNVLYFVARLEMA